MEFNNILNSKIKPDLTELTNEQILQILETNNIITDKLNDRNHLINLIIKIWSEHKYYDSIDCPICLDYITNIDHMVTKCGHYFHSTCYTKYIVKSIINDKNKELKCPQCRDILIENIQSNNPQSQINSILTNGLNMVINNSSILSEHQDVFFPQTSIFGSRFEDLEQTQYNDIEDVDDIVDNYTFPINLHSGMWTDVSNLTGILFPNIVAGLNYNSESGTSTSTNTITDSTTISESESIEESESDNV